MRGLEERECVCHVSALFSSPSSSFGLDENDAGIVLLVLAGVFVFRKDAPEGFVLPMMILGLCSSLRFPLSLSFFFCFVCFCFI